MIQGLRTDFDWQNLVDLNSPLVPKPSGGPAIRTDDMFLLEKVHEARFVFIIKYLAHGHGI